ncbi:MAG: response regulator [Oscillospiraceae bacterium]|nr:response regulator [Oscillospiraceae bacterium]
MKKRKLGVTGKAVIIICALLLGANMLLGTTMMRRSREMLQSSINMRMLDISNTAAAMVNGDALKNLTAGDEDTQEYRQIYDTLRVFQDNIELEYIYTIRDMGNGSFIFLVDPAEEDASEFGELVTVTEALKTASLGTPSVDKEPYEDQWGRFYSAYSPVRDSEGRVVGLVAVDFRADWYDEQLTKYSQMVLLSSIMSLVVGVAVIIAVTARLRGSIRELDGELGELTDDVDKLMDELGIDASASAGAEQKDGEKAGRSTDEIGELGKKISSIRADLRERIDNTQTQANSMVTALASDYRSVYYVDLDEDEGVCYRAHSKIDNGLREGEHFSFREVFHDYAYRYVAQSYRESFLNFVSPEAIRAALRDETLIAHRYLVVRDGQESYEMLRIAGVRHPEDRDDHIVHAVGLGFSDVDKETRESMAQRTALRDALTMAEDASRAKTSFLSSMSHEIRTPMNAIIGLDSIALNDPGIDRRTRDYLEKIGVSARHLLSLINDILDMSRIESGRMIVKNEEFSFPRLLEQINAMIGSQCRDKGLKYSCSTVGALGDYYIGDDMKLKQVLINVLGNAVKFTPKGGSVKLSAECAMQFGGKSVLRFTVRDNGIGMDKAFLPKIFDAFSQEDSSTTSKYGSTGLGMAITKSLVEMMNGKIEVESEKDVGTTFIISVTLIDSERKDSAEREIRPQGLCVLVIDDDPVAREHARLVLERAGVAVELAQSGADALEMVRLRHARRASYDLILVDWQMPEMDGVETIRRIRGMIGGESAIAILTAHNWDGVFEEAVDAGADNFIAKPLSQDTVMEELRQTLQKNVRSEGKKAELAGRRVLLAEDTAINAEIMTEVLGMSRIEVEHAENGAIAVQMFSSHDAGWYDAILMDMRMPEMDGLEATMAIRALAREDAKSVPIIALTANAFDEDVQRSLQAGLNAHLSKPVEPEKLFSTLESLIR